MKWVAKVMRAMGLEANECVKPPELGRAIKEEELRSETLGFIAIVDRKQKKIYIRLCLKALMLDEAGNGEYKHTLKWEEYGRTWQAYEIGAFEGWGEDDA